MPINTVSDLQALGELVHECIIEWKNNSAVDAATVIALHGDLGAGKTTFVQALARQLGVTETVTSPTFVIMKSYETSDDMFSVLVHIDAYRIESTAEMDPLHFETILTSTHTLVCIEWAERIATLLPISTKHISFTLESNETRTITYGEKN
jgi:tRNA threonylcarbamoyladenosine biosynthesis protein TsaE